MQVERVLRALGNELHIKARRFTADESMAEREKTLREFANGEIEAIVAIKCLDEGVDIPRTETAYILASSKNPRQFIQRRGRVLRQSEGKKFATIYDFVVIPSSTNLEDNESVYKIHRNLVRGELQRVVEFANSAINGPVARDVLRDVIIEFDLLEV